MHPDLGREACPQADGDAVKRNARDFGQYPSDRTFLARSSIPALDHCADPWVFHEARTLDVRRPLRISGPDRRSRGAHIDQVFLAKALASRCEQLQT